MSRLRRIRRLDLRPTPPTTDPRLWTPNWDWED